MFAVFEMTTPLDFVIVLAVIISVTKLVGLLFRHYGMPQVLGYIIAGLLIGPSIFGEFCNFTIIGFYDSVVAGEYSALFALHDAEALQIFSKIGVLLLMFSAGLETNLEEIKNTGLLSVIIAFVGVVIPLGLGVLISLPFGNIGLGTENVMKGVFVGTILAATSVAITVSVLKELGKFNTKLGTTIVSAAIIDDIIGIVLLSIVTGMAKEQASEGASAFEVFKTSPFGTVVMVVAFFVVAIAFGILVSKLFKWLDKRWPTTHRLPVFSLAVCFLYSWVAESVFGVADITGAFLAGVILSTDHRACVYVDKKVEVNTYTLFAPVFFANIGISYINFGGFKPEILLFSLLFVFVGLAGKVATAFVFKGFGFTLRQSLIGGVGMMARGEVALIVTTTVTAATLGANALGQEFMIATVLLILFSSILTPILLKLLYKREDENADSSEK